MKFQQLSNVHMFDVVCLVVETVHKIRNEANMHFSQNLYSRVDFITVAILLKPSRKFGN